MLDARFEVTSLTPANIATIVSAVTCDVSCLGSCSGPGERSCLSYVRLADLLTSRVVNGNIVRWYATDPIFSGYSLASLNYAFTGWYYVASNAVLNNLFRLQNIEANCIGGASRIMAIFLTVPPLAQFRMDTTTTNDFVVTDFSLPVRT